MGIVWQNERMHRTIKGTKLAKGTGIDRRGEVFSQPKEGLVSQMGCGSKQPKGLEYLQRIKCQAAKGVGRAIRAKVLKSQRGQKFQTAKGVEVQEELRCQTAKGVGIARVAKVSRD